jgi:hypothetical protein
MGWLMFKLKPLPPFDNVADLRKDPLVAWQHRYIHLIAVLVAFVLQASIGFVWGGWKAALYLFSAAKAQGPIFLLCTHFRSFQGDFRRIQVGSITTAVRKPLEVEVAQEGRALRISFDTCER